MLEPSQAFVGKVLQDVERGIKFGVRVNEHVSANQINKTTFSKNQPAGPESKIVRLAGERFRVCLEKLIVFKCTKAALVSKTLVCSLSL